MIQTIAPVLFPPILVATDGSPSAGLALDIVRPIAQLLSQSMSQEEPSDVLSVLTVEPKVSKEKPKVAAQSSPNGSATSPPAHSLAAQTSSVEIRYGRPISEILNYAREIKAGLIAVGHRSSSGGVRELLLGSVPTAIARYAPCSVLVARGPADPALQPTLRHGLLVVENDTSTQHAIATARQLVAAGIQQITLLYVQPMLNAGYLMGPIASHTPNWQLDQSLQTVQKEQAEQVLEQTKATLNLDSINIHLRTQKGDPGPSICQIAQELQVNLILLGSKMARRSLPSPLQAMRLRKSTSAIPRPLLRNTRLSVTEDYVIHYAPCPVLLCRGE